MIPPLFSLAPLMAALLLAPEPLQDTREALDAETRAALVERLAGEVEARYCIPEAATEIARHLRAELAAGTFDACTSRAALAPKLTTALRAVNGDRHFNVWVRPPGRIEEEEVDPLGAWLREEEERRARNAGLASVEVLPGNVGVIDLRGFASVAQAREPLVAAMAVVARVDALVFDLRQNGGGDPATVQLLCSFFFGERTHLNSLVYRLPEGGERVEEFWTLDEVPGERRVDLPLFVVTSGRTGSAAEEFTYNLKSRRRALIVGERTGGAANPGGAVALDDFMEAFISTGRALNPVTGTNWEGVGVEPDVEVAMTSALDKALSLARESAAEFREWRRGEREAELEEARAAVREAMRLAGEGRRDEALETLRAPLGDALELGLLGEVDLAELGWHELERERPAGALALLCFNADAFPASASAQAGAAEAWRANGEEERALVGFRRALELDPGFEPALQAVRELERE